jgi:CNT family concentrative nucleoside transporter
MGMDAGHLLTASVLSAPASLLIAKIMIPETQASPTADPPAADAEDIAMPDALPSDLSAQDQLDIDMGETGNNLLEAIAIGTLEGLKLTLNVAAMLIAFLALIALVDGLLGWAGGLVGQVWSLKAILGPLFAPMAWLMGIPWEDCTNSGNLLGIKMVANEFVAYSELSEWQKAGSGVLLNERSIAILTYALCGFANFSSIGIQIGGIGGMAPERRGELAKLGLRAMLGGTLANFMTACVAGIMIQAG